MKKFNALSRNEMKKVKGGVKAFGSCSATCGGRGGTSSTVTCTGTDCFAIDGDGCFAIDANSNPVQNNCPVII